MIQNIKSSKQINIGNMVKLKINNKYVFLGYVTNIDNSKSAVSVMVTKSLSPIFKPLQYVSFVMNDSYELILI
jgi:hypothetical protein